MCNALDTDGKYCISWHRTRPCQLPICQYTLLERSRCAGTSQIQVLCRHPWNILPLGISCCITISNWSRDHRGRITALNCETQVSHPSWETKTLRSVSSVALQGSLPVTSFPRLNFIKSHFLWRGGVGAGGGGPSCNISLPTGQKERCIYKIQILKRVSTPLSESSELFFFLCHA